MNGEEYKKLIMGLLNELDETDRKFLVQLYTIIKKHFERRGR